MWISYPPPTVTRLTSNVTPVSGTGAATTLMTYTLPAGTLSPGQALRINCFGTMAANANNKQVDASFGAATVTPALAGTFNNLPWLIEFVVTALTATTQQISLISYVVQGQGVRGQCVSASETLSGAITIKCTQTTGSSGDITQTGMLVELIP